MQKFINFTFFMGVIIALLINAIDAKKSKFSKQPKKKLLNDGYYAIFVNTTISSGHNKREVQEEFINSLVDEIHGLILGNVNTYQNPEVVEEMINTEKLRKRDHEEAESEVVYHLSSLDDRSVIGAFLSNDLIENIRGFKDVYDVLPNRQFKYIKNINDDNYSGLNSNVRHNADFHLSLISQDNLTGKNLEDYDNTYYPLGNAGEGVDIFIFDTGFSFEHSEFENNSNRITKCVANLSYGKVDYPRSERFCFSMYRKEHGTIVADVAAGAVHGVASNANVYGFVVEEGDPTIFSVFKGFELLTYGNKDKRGLLNLSIGDYYPNDEENSGLTYLHDLIKKLNNKGIVVVAAAGNDDEPVIDTKNNRTFYPCAFEEVICVGSTNNRYLTTYNEEEKKEIFNNPYNKANFSNYGQGVDIYAPGYVNYTVYNPYYGIREGITHGTSYSTPIVVGVAASIMSENDIKYNAKTMKKELYKRSYQGVVEGENNADSNYFINNGAVKY